MSEAKDLSPAQKTVLFDAMRDAADAVARLERLAHLLTGADSSFSVAVDMAGNMLLVATTDLQGGDPVPVLDAFLARLDALGARLLNEAVAGLISEKRP